MGKLKLVIAVAVASASFVGSWSWADPGKPASANSPRANYQSRLQITQDQFEDSNRLHTERVTKLMLAGWRRYKSFLSGITEELVVAKGMTHDKSKNDTTPEFYASVGYTNPKSIPKRLYDELGTPHSTSAPKSRADLAVFVDMDAIDLQVDEQFNGDFNLLNADGALSLAGQILSFMVRDADLVDRGENPFTEIEMGRRASPASEYDKSLTGIRRLYVKYLESEYSRIVGDSILSPLLRPQQCKIILRLKARGRLVTSRIH